jgi:hypothetical protein
LNCVALADGTVHLVYFKGDPSEGDLFYIRSKHGAKFSNPIRVNSIAGTAVAIGNIRGARIAVGRRGNVFVIWNGSRQSGDPGLGRSPMLFSRLKDDGTAFEPERNLIHTVYGIDGGRRKRRRPARPSVRVLARSYSRQAERTISISHRVGETGSADGVPVWSTVAAHTKRNGDFVVLY